MSAKAIIDTTRPSRWSPAAARDRTIGANGVTAGPPCRREVLADRRSGASPPRCRRWPACWPRHPGAGAGTAPETRAAEPRPPAAPSLPPSDAPAGEEQTWQPDRRPAPRSDLEHEHRFRAADRRAPSAAGATAAALARRSAVGRPAAPAEAVVKVRSSSARADRGRPPTRSRGSRSSAKLTPSPGAAPATRSCSATAGKERTPVRRPTRSRPPAKGVGAGVVTRASEEVSEGSACVRFGRSDPRRRWPTARLTFPDRAVSYSFCERGLPLFPSPPSRSGSCCLLLSRRRAP